LNMKKKIVMSFALKIQNRS